MHISRIEIENIKSYANGAFDFARGTTAITGENGAGKTTIIEAIAWVLFDLLEYKKDDFVRRGEKKGSVSVSLVSGLDEREYVIFRDTAAGYNVTDPQLGVRIADKREEVTRFLWQHLGLEPGTDLRSLFRQAIGVPQGTFTAIFLEGHAERKAAFDRLLKVEEYRQAAEKLRETSRYLDSSVAGVRENIARGEGELGRTGLVTEEHAKVKEDLDALSREREEVSRVVEKTRAEEGLLAVAARNHLEAKSAADRILIDHEKATISQDQAMRELTQAEVALQIIAKVGPYATKHLDATERLKVLEADRRKRDAIRSRKSEVEKEMVALSAEISHLNERLARSIAAANEIEELAPKVRKHENFDKALADARDRIASARLAENRLADRTKRIVTVRESYRQNQTQMLNSQQMATVAATLASLETMANDLVKQIADHRARLETDERFRREIENGFCPVLTERCLNMKPGQKLEDYVADRSRELQTQIDAAEKNLLGLQPQLAKTREAQIIASSLEDYRARRAQIIEEGRSLKSEISNLEKESSQLVAIEREASELESSIAALGDPKARTKYLTAEMENAGSLNRNLAAAKLRRDQTETENASLENDLATFGEIDRSLEEAVSVRDLTLDAYRTFVANEAPAKLHEERKKTLDESRLSVTMLAEHLAAATTNLDAAARAYDAERHNVVRADLMGLERTQARVDAEFEAAGRREKQLAAELARFAEVRRQLADDFREKERLENTAETTAFIRDTLKEAAPRVAKNYVFRVSLEANQLFREITGDADRSLRWAEDYSVTLEEGGFERPFVSLSGGEQMSAALAVRLALLKQLSDTRIAFFDEPTTNMDAERRENFAAEIGRVKNFDQLFVISHDETFDEYVDHHIHIERERQL